jgi:hypothetical protein
MMPFMRENIERYTIEELEDILNIGDLEITKISLMTLEEKNNFFNNYLVLRNRLNELKKSKEA